MRAIIMTSYDPLKFKGGTEKIVLHTRDLLREEGFQVDIFHKDNTQKVGDYFPYWIGRHAHSCGEKYDLAVINNIAGLGFFPGKARRTVAVFHMLYLAFSHIMRGYENFEDYIGNAYLNGYISEVFVGNAANRLIAVSESVKEEIEKYMGVEKDIIVVHNPVMHQFSPMEKLKARSVFNIPKDAFVGLYVGRNDYTKGYDIFREVVSYTYRDIFWVQVISSGGLNTLPVLKDITTFKEVPFENMPLIYNLADFLLFPSRYEGFGLSIVEALACGIPVITAKVGVAKELGNFLDGLLIESLDIKDILERIRILKQYRCIREYYKIYVTNEISRRFSLISWRENMKKALLS
ncbi:MAG: glycosyltransferase family 4 protein [Hydrogenobacter sp.]